MTAQKGKDLLLKVDAESTGSFVSVAGLRSNAMDFNTETVDITHMESAGRWRELLAGAGVRSAAIRGSGVFKDASSDELVRGLFFDGVICPWQLAIPNFGLVQGAFQVTALEFAGQHNGELTYELSLESAGVLSFTADA